MSQYEKREKLLQVIQNVYETASQSYKETTKKITQLDLKASLKFSLKWLVTQKLNFLEGFPLQYKTFFSLKNLNL